MRFLIISDTDKISFDLHNNLKKNGYESTLLTHNIVENDNSIINISNLNNRNILWLKHAIRSFIFRHIVFRITGYSYYQDISENCNYYSINRIKKKLKFKPDIILILFDYRIVTTRTILELYKWSKAKILWMMVDMKPMTGGCSYSGECEKYISNCYNCPAIGNFIFKNFASRTLNQKSSNLARLNIEIIAGSTFQKSQAQKSSIFRNKLVHHIFFPLDEKIFNSKNKGEARKLLYLPSNSNILLFGAMHLNEERKGFQFLLNALLMLNDKYLIKDLLLLIVGDGSIKDLDKLPYKRINLGFVSYDRLALAYQASDVFVCPSIEDSGPIMVNQSIMCGTPVVSFEMGVCIDLVKDGRTGFLAKLKDSSSLCEGIYKVLSSSPIEKARMTSECIKISNKLGFKDFYKNLDKLIDCKDS